MFKRLLPLLLITLFLWSCATKNKGILVSTDGVREAPDQEAPVIKYFNAGTEVEYIGEQPFPANDSFAKVKIGDVEGFVYAKKVVFGAKPVVAREDLSGSYEPLSPGTMQVAEGSFLLTDSVSGDKSQIYFVTKATTAWVDTKGLSTDPDDIAVAAAIDRLTQGTQRDLEGNTVFEEATVKYANHKLFQSFKVNLSEPTDADLSDMRTRMIFAYDKPNNTITLVRAHATSIAKALLGDVLKRPRGDSERGYMQDNGQYVITNPIEIYFYKYISALPSYVKVTGLSEAADWDIMEKEQPEAAFFLYRMDRSPENLRNLYTQFRPVIEGLITSHTIRNLRDEGNKLIRVYNNITAGDNYKAVMDDLIKKVEAWDKKKTNKDGRVVGGYAALDQRELYEPIIDERIFELEGSENKAMWYHSFWLRRFKEGNAEVVYEILTDLVAIEPGDSPEYADGEEVYGEEAEEEGFGDAPDDYPTGNEEPVTTTCVYNGYSVGDCGHYDFGDCGDYGDADTSELTEASLELWNNLVVTDANGDEVGNPIYVGKKFSITETVTYSNICNEGQGGMGKAPKILSISVIQE